MLYEDPEGAKLVAGENATAISGFGPYLKLIARHPIAMGGVFARHVINGLDERYSTPYVEHLDNGSRRLVRLIGFLLAFLALLRVAWGAARRTLGAAHWRYLIAVLACSVTALPTAIEPRFLLPLCLAGYLLVLAPGWPTRLMIGRSWSRDGRTLFIIAFGCAVFLIVVLDVASNTSRHLHLA